MSTGDGWTICASGHRHWGRYGAAGLMIIDTDRVVLQHRAPWTHEGDRWGVLGGARNSHEDAVQAALREAHEEAGIDAALIDPIGLYVDDHIGWTYTTVVARPLGAINPGPINAESVSVQWHRIAEVNSLPLHSGFEAAWQHLKSVPRKLYLVVPEDLADGPVVKALMSTGVRADQLPDALSAEGLTTLLPGLVTVPSADLTSAVAQHYQDGQLILIGSQSDLARYA